MPVSFSRHARGPAITPTNLLPVRVTVMVAPALTVQHQVGSILCCLVWLNTFWVIDARGTLSTIRPNRIFNGSFSTGRQNEVRILYCALSNRVDHAGVDHDPTMTYYHPKFCILTSLIPHTEFRPSPRKPPWVSVATTDCLSPVGLAWHISLHTYPRVSGHLVASACRIPWAGCWLYRASDGHYGRQHDFRDARWAGLKKDPAPRNGFPRERATVPEAREGSSDACL